MSDTNDGTLRQDYGRYATLCSVALQLTLERILGTFRLLYFGKKEQDPILSVQTRVKDFESAIEKCKSKGLEPSVEQIQNRVRDVAGIRIITTFEDEIYEVKRIIQSIPGINIVDEKDYVKNPKASGYRSLHLIAQIEVYRPVDGGESRLVPVEIQIRDILMDAWATIEHGLGYKNPHPSAETAAAFTNAAERLHDFDLTVLALRNGGVQEP